MTNYYKDKNRALAELDTLLKSAMQSKNDVSINSTLYEFSKKHPVSDKVIMKQIERFSEIHDLKIKGDLVVMS